MKTDELLKLVDGRKYLIKHCWMPEAAWAIWDASEGKFLFSEKPRSRVDGLEVDEIVAEQNGSEKVEIKVEKNDRISVYRDIMHNFEIADREKWVELKRSLEEKREQLCQQWGGHFYGEPQEDTVKMAIGWRREVSRICAVCRKKDYVKVEHED